ncbi:hypothetical protein EUGRSUZ_E00469 [Eucalyptus grandis]|uniref:Uncharacterized protein n=2 Tax=Eucalyptus grandis TaxID=71139 RepID=A0ACC3KRZ9_EUCGR|nr:hypothetical protein EUGRSUZ_E00469 [Eucalyptus grandis]
MPTLIWPPWSLRPSVLMVAPIFTSSKQLFVLLVLLISFLSYTIQFLIWRFIWTCPINPIYRMSPNTE